MKKFSLILPLMVLTSCSWLLTHPKEDALVLEVGKDIAEDVYEYETGSLLNMPPFKSALIGPTIEERR